MIETFADSFSLWLVQYGYIALFGLLALGIVVLPVPEDTLMILAGVLIYQGVLPPGLTYLSALLGSICGITVSYLIGRTVGEYLLKKYGKYIGITEERLARVHWWFERYGKWVIFFGFFVPGLRHFTGLFAGISYLEYKVFSLYAYCGATLWVSLLISIGYFFGNCCESFIEFAEDNIEYALSALAIAFLIYLGIKILYNSRFPKNLM
jgi:membrane protein DedA with SNARE-associated domain